MQRVVRSTAGKLLLVLIAFCTTPSLALGQCRPYECPTAEASSCVFVSKCVSEACRRRFLECSMADLRETITKAHQARKVQPAQ